MKRRNFIFALTLIYFAPKYLFIEKVESKLLIKNGWILKRQDL